MRKITLLYKSLEILIRVFPMGLLVEFEVLLVDKLVMGESVEGKALKTFRLSLGPFCR